MIRIPVLVIMLTLFGQVVSGGVVPVNELVKVTPDEDSDHHWPYYLYVPDSKLCDLDSVTILVKPNNTGSCDDDYSVHDRDALRSAHNLRDLADALEVAVLVPSFPRPKEHGLIYTHALDRDVMLTDVKELYRLDLQLLSMIDDAIARLRDKGYRVNERVLMMGFSASGMFVNRFAVLHPGRVRAVACGSPGGWPIAPVGEWEGSPLRFPVGVNDVERLTGTAFDSSEFASLPLFLYLGDQDTNDAVAYDDGYDDPDRELVFRLFGDTPVSRWPLAERIYKQVSGNCRVKLYEGVGHEVNREMWKDIRAFLKEYR